MFRDTLQSSLEKDDRKSNARRKPYDKLLMFKILILQRYHNLSDAQTEYLIKETLKKKISK